MGGVRKRGSVNGRVQKGGVLTGGVTIGEMLSDGVRFRGVEIRRMVRGECVIKGWSQNEREC